MRSIRLPLLLGLLCVAASPATATNLIYTWTGVITAVDAAIAAGAPPFALNDPFSATAVIDDATVGMPTGNTGQLSYSPVVSVSLTLNGVYTINGTPGASSLAVTHDPGVSDEFRATGASVFGAPDVGVWRPSTFQTILDTPLDGVLASNALPTSLDLNDWTNDFMFVSFIDTTNPSSFLSVSGDITGVSVTVPEPTLAGLLGSGLLALVAYSPRRSRSGGKRGAQLSSGTRVARTANATNR